MYYKQNQNIDESRFIDGDIKKIHDLLKSDCNIINEHLIKYYACNVQKMYKYFNPNLIRNRGLIKIDQKIIMISRQVLKHLFKMIKFYEKTQ